MTQQTKTDVLWELAHVNHDLNQALKSYTSTRCLWLELQIHRLREQRDTLMEKLH